MALRVDGHYPRGHDVSDRDNFVRIAYEAIGQLTDVDEPTVLQTNVNKRTKVHDVQDGAAQFHARF